VATTGMPHFGQMGADLFRSSKRSLHPEHVHLVPSSGLPILYSQAMESPQANA
jgi:hypothetical protein